MVSFSDFDEQYQLINQLVGRIFWDQEGRTSQLDPRWSADVYITLKAGKTYRITVDTPDHLKQSMEKSNRRSHFEEGLILVKEISLECILDAVENLLADNYYGLPFYGLSQEG